MLLAPKNASRSLFPRRPWSKLLWVMASHLTSSVSMVSPLGPSSRRYIWSTFLGSALTVHWKRGSLGRLRIGACMAGGV